MKRLFTKITIVVCAALSAVTVAMAEGSNGSKSSEAAEIEMLKQRLEALESEQAKRGADSFYAPQLYGSMMAYFNVNTYDGDQRFAVRNAQVGFRGNASNNISYLIQVNFHNLAKVTVLDSYIRYKYQGFDLTLGQQWTHLTADFDRCGPKSRLFTSRSYGVVYVPVYSDGSSLSSFGNRDIGLYGNYTFDGALPITLSLGVFNGAGVNNIEWDNDINVTGRIQVGGKRGLSGGASIYEGNTLYNQSSTLLSGELRYVTDLLFVEANYQQKRVEMSGAADQVTRTGLIEGYYTIKTPQSKLFDSYAPTVRYDFGEGMLYSNLSSGDIEEQDAGRLTAQMSFMLKGSKIRSRLSVGYEMVMMGEKPSDIAENPLFQDRFTVAMALAF